MTQDLSSMLPNDLPDDPIYICFVNGKIHIPEVIFRKLNSKDQRKEHAESSETFEENSTEDTTPYVPDTLDLEDSSDNEKSRFEWKFSDTEELLAVLKARKEKKDNFSKNMWKSVATEIKGELKTNPSPEQCREKFYSLRRSYRNFIAEKKKTGNKRTKPFIHESEMYDLLHDDPAFSPPLLMSSFATIETCDSDENTTEKDPPKKRRCTSSNELTEYLKERDEKFLHAFKEMHEKQNKIMEKPIEKL
ncbi:uncharacterized protein LOC125660619 [Ostrea edulis]|uniref:uncharacterized protein LOC125660619 n=1 Tax=Ostrea edulis TaxID=37623 RepID=UPI0024AFA341|nr:uncharacterized protein LOC125660619 [Ostrea edulis]